MKTDYTKLKLSDYNTFASDFLKIDLDYGLVLDVAYVISSTSRPEAGCKDVPCVDIVNIWLNGVPVHFWDLLRTPEARRCQWALDKIIEEHVYYELENAGYFTRQRALDKMIGGNDG